MNRHKMILWVLGVGVLAACSFVPGCLPERQAPKPNFDQATMTAHKAYTDLIRATGELDAATAELEHQTVSLQRATGRYNDATKMRRLVMAAAEKSAVDAHQAVLDPIIKELEAQGSRVNTEIQETRSQTGIARNRVEQAEAGSTAARLKFKAEVQRMIQCFTPKEIAEIEKLAPGAMGVFQR